MISRDQYARIDKIIKRIRLVVSLLFILFLYLPFFLPILSSFSLLITLKESYAFREFIFLSIIVFLLAYFIVYNSKYLKKFMLAEISFSRLLGYIILLTSSIYGLCWGTFGWFAYQNGVALCILFPFFGIFLGAIYSFISSLIILNLRKRILKP